MSHVTPELTSRQLATLLRATSAAVRAELEALPDAAARHHPTPDDWCVNEVVGHLIEAEQRGFAGRIRSILEHPGRDLEEWDQAAVARERRDCQREPAELLRQFAADRASSARMVERVTRADLDRFGVHPDPDLGRLTVRELLHEWPHHDRVHHEQLLAAVRSAIWPHMGATQHFYD